MAHLFLLPVFLFLAGVMVCGPAQAADPIGAVDAMTGECHIIRGGDTLAAELQQPVMLNDEVSTGEGARISILFQDETVLSLDELSHASIDQYVYSDDASNLLFKFTKGTFRTITGGIVKQNPEGFNMETPLVTIGIRGSDVYAIIQPEGEETGALHLGEGHALEVKSAVQTIRLTESGMRVRISPQGIIFTPTRIPASMFNNMLNLGSPAPTSTPAAPSSSSSTTKSVKTPVTTKTRSSTPTLTPKTTRNPKTTLTPKGTISPKTKVAPTLTPTITRTPIVPKTSAPTVKQQPTFRRTFQ